MRAIGEGRVRTAAAMCAAAVLAMSAGACASAGGMGTMGGSTPDGAAYATAAAINMAEVEEAQLALQMATGAEARQYAQRMITEHAPMLQRVQETMRAMRMMPAGSAAEMDGAVATSGGLNADGTVSASTSAAAADPAMMRVVMENQYSRPLAEDHQRAMQMLRGTARGMAFDHAYLQRQVAAHRSALAAIDRLMPSVQAGGDAETRGMLAAMRPAVEQHLRMAEQMMAGMRH